MFATHFYFCFRTGHRLFASGHPRIIYWIDHPYKKATAHTLNMIYVAYLNTLPLRTDGRKGKNASIEVLIKIKFGLDSHMAALCIQHRMLSWRDLFVNITGNAFHILVHPCINEEELWYDHKILSILHRYGMIYKSSKGVLCHLRLQCS